jgi:hypothetical protein
VTRRKDTPRPTIRDWHDTLSRVEDALSTFLAAARNSEPPPSPELLEWYAEKYADMAFECLHVAAALTPEQINSRISKIEKPCLRLLDELRTLREPVVDALNSARGLVDHRRLVLTPAACQSGHRAPTLGELQRSLEWLGAICKVATPPNSAKHKRGRDPKLFPLKVAKAAASDFYALAGEEPTGTRNRGGFGDFPSAIFAALDLRDASADSFARQAVRWWKNDRPHESDPAKLPTIRVVNE